ncbi:MAG: VWA domain-containing protein [Bacteroidales bacterium]|nr:VWA domain-containing protein [Bacteroidales bacterium]MDD4216167.1 VWA domain-containing protein [Bacteroidales bacterium]MDY0141774.1 VWA domain-containing protein [Bacteroidales bacterium]
MFRFQEPQYLWLIASTAIVVLLFLLAEYIRRKRMRKIGDHKLVNLLIPETSIIRRIWKLVLICVAIVSMSVALARPQFGSKLNDVTRQGVEIVVALDVSNSMLAQDIKPNRLENARKFTERIISKLENDKLGIIVFAGDAFVQMPITDDVRSARLFLSTIDTESVPVQGTAIAKAIDLAAKSFTKEEEISKIILLITDGENHEDNAVEIAKTLKEKNISIYTVGMGLPGGAPIPKKRGGGFMKDRDGNVVISVLDEQTLISIADETGGVYVRAGNSADASDKIINEIGKLQKGEVLKQNYSEYADQFQYLALLALILLLVDIIISEKKNSVLSRINLFKKKKHWV